MHFVVERKTDSHYKAGRVDTSLLCHVSQERVKAAGQGHQKKASGKLQGTGAHRGEGGWAVRVLEAVDPTPGLTLCLSKGHRCCPELRQVL